MLRRIIAGTGVHGTKEAERHHGLFSAFHRLGLSSPSHIQGFVDALPYNSHTDCHSPRRVLEKGCAHCAEGAYFAACALSGLGHPPLVVDLAAQKDDDHIIAVYRNGPLWGAAAKSNTTLLRGRQPVYRSLRELVMSYFDFYFNTDGYFSLRGYTRPVDLRMFEALDWMETEEDINVIGDRLGAAYHYPCLPGLPALEPADKDVVAACFMTSDPRGLYRPDGK